MFINFKVLKNLKNYSLDENSLYLLCAINQVEEQEVIDLYYDDKLIKEWLSLGFIKELKKGGYRIDKKGRELLKRLSSSVDIEQETHTIVDWLVNVYKGKPGGIIKNKTETKRRCQWFSDNTGLTRNKLALLLQSFMLDTYNPESGLTIEQYGKENPRMVLSNMLDNVFWKPPNNFARNYTLDNSPLYTYLENNYEFVEEIWRNNKVV